MAPRLQSPPVMEHPLHSIERDQLDTVTGGGVSDWLGLGYSVAKDVWNNREAIGNGARQLHQWAQSPGTDFAKSAPQGA